MRTLLLMSLLIAGCASQSGYQVDVHDPMALKCTRGYHTVADMMAKNYPLYQHCEAWLAKHGYLSGGSSMGYLLPMGQGYAIVPPQ